MSLSTKYLLYILVLHIAITALLYHWLQKDPWWFLASELLVMLSLSIAYRLYRQTVRPLSLIKSGTSSILNNDFSIKYVETGSSDLDGLIQVYNHMMDVLRKERTQVQSQGFLLESIIQASPIGIMILDFDDRIALMNPKIMQLLGVDAQMLGKDILEIPHDLAKALSRMSCPNEQIQQIGGNKKYKCAINEVIHQGFRRKFILVEDLSLAFLQTEKEAYGKVIRMMAHETNNAMGAVNSILQTVIEFGFTEEGADMRHSLETAHQRNAELANFMANFAAVLRVPDPQKSKCSLQQLLQPAYDVWKVTAAAHDIALTLACQTNRMVEIDIGLFQQVLSNVLKNAIQSIGHDGTIQIYTTDYPATIVIADNGKGISEEAAAALFSPFFSTKAHGQGIGLMIIQDILQKHDIPFTLKTEEDGWTRFVMWV